MPFIVGCGRSGNTLLRMILDSHPDTAIPPETEVIAAAGTDVRARALHIGDGREVAASMAGGRVGNAMKVVVAGSFACAF